MSAEIAVLCATAASLGFVHTVIGPDHYLPFIVMGRARRWSLSRTILITLTCGIGHVLSSIALGFLGIAMGIGVMKLEMFEGFRGNIAAWLLIGFGLAYCVWGLLRAARNKHHTHIHFHDCEDQHEHAHNHHNEHAHAHPVEKRKLTPWILFTIFVFGPCEPLIPIQMYPAAKSSIAGVFLVAGIFGMVTILTMTVIVAGISWGAGFARFSRLERYTHALAGAAIFLSGLTIQIFGL